MKTKKILVSGLIAVILMFAFIACDDGNDPNNGNGDPNGGGGKTSFGDKLELSGQVYTRGDGDWGKFDGDLALKTDAAWGASGEIKGGKLTYTVGTPPAASLMEIARFTSYDNFGDDYEGLITESRYTDITISDESVKFAQLDFIEVTGSNTYHIVEKGGISANANGSTRSGTMEMVKFMYVDNPVTITAAGRTETYNDINLSLKAGWNAIYRKDSFSENIETEEVSFTSSISIGNPDLKWVLDFSYIEPDQEDSDW